jgi:hypothetical protein
MQYYACRLILLNVQKTEGVAIAKKSFLLRKAKRLLIILLVSSFFFLVILTWFICFQFSIEGANDSAFIL